MNNAPNIRIEVTEGAQIPDPRDRRLLNAWTLAFCVAVVALVTLCATQPEPYLEIVKFLPDGLIITFEVTVLSLLCTLPIGLLTGLGRLSRNPVINLIASTYVEIIRGVPLLVQLFYIYYALGRIIQVPPMVSAVIAISFCYGAYMGEVFRAGILSVPKGQTEAARSLGFNNFQTMTLVILPQAMRTILPPIGNECIAMLKDTSLVSIIAGLDTSIIIPWLKENYNNPEIIAVADLLRRGREFASQTFDYFETYTVIALVYLIITLLLSKGVSMMEGRLTYYDRDRK